MVNLYRNIRLWTQCIYMHSAPLLPGSETTMKFVLVQLRPGDVKPMNELGMGWSILAELCIYT